MEGWRGTLRHSLKHLKLLIYFSVSAVRNRSMVHGVLILEVIVYRLLVTLVVKVC